MKKEDIEKAAVNHDSRMVAFSAFIKGAEWRINSVWHKVDEVPENGRCLLGISPEYGSYICGPHNEDFAEIASEMDIIKWAYVEDLMPDMEE